MPRSDGPFHILEKIGPNAYKVDLPSEYEVPATFNSADLSSYYEKNEELPSLKSNSNQAGGYDGDHPLEPLEHQPLGPQKPASTKEVREVHAGFTRKLTRFCLPLGASY